MQAFDHMRPENFHPAEYTSQFVNEPTFAFDFIAGFVVAESIAVD